MKLCIKQKVFSWADRFNIMDINGSVLFTAAGELFSWGKKLHVYNNQEQEIIFIKQRLWTFLPKYEIYLHGQKIAEVVKEFTFMVPRYTIRMLGWEVAGDFFAHDYTIACGGQHLASMHKEWFTWGDCYVLEIPDSRNTLPAMAVMLAIDCITSDQDNN